MFGSSQHLASRAAGQSRSFRLVRGMAADTGKVASALVSDLAEITSEEDPINCILEAHESGAVGLVAAADQLEKALEDKKLLQQMQLAPQMVGAHPENRGSQCVSALEVSVLAADIVEVGWSWKETQQPVLHPHESGASQHCSGHAER